MKKIYKANIPLPNEAVQILQTLHGAGYEAFVIGGAIRCFLTGQTAKDFDITTNAPENVVTELFESTKLIGRAFGVVQVNINGSSFEVARFRQDGNYCDGRRPESVTFADGIEADISRRDFTCNALYYDMRTEEIVDLTGGVEDINNKVLRCIGNPEDRFLHEDCLRMLRAVRFAAKLGFEIEKNTFKMIKENAAHILRISWERIRQELNGILLSGNAYRGMKLLQRSNLLQAILPEVALGAYFTQQNPHHKYNLLDHTLNTFKGFPKSFHSLDDEKRLTVMLALLLHDTGKIDACTSDGSVCHFYQHEKFSEKIAEKALKRLLYSNDIIHDVTLLVYCHGREIPKTSASVKKLLNTLGEDLFQLWHIVKRQDALAHSNYMNKRQKALTALKGVEGLYRNVKRGKECFDVKTLAINGNDLIALGFKESPAIGDILNHTLELVIDGKLANEREELLAFAESKLL